MKPALLKSDNTYRYRARRTDRMTGLEYAACVLGVFGILLMGAEAETLTVQIAGGIGGLLMLGGAVVLWRLGGRRSEKNVRAAGSVMPPSHWRNNKIWK